MFWKENKNLHPTLEIKDHNIVEIYTMSAKELASNTVFSREILTTITETAVMFKMLCLF